MRDSIRKLVAMFAVFAVYGFAAPSAAVPMTLTIDLLPSLEVQNPPVVSNATGVATLEFDLDMPADGIDFTIELQNITTPLLFAHIHGAPPGVNGPILVDLFDFTGLPFQVFGDNVVMTGTVMLDQATIDAIVAGAAYVNVHTEAFPMGELRGNIVPEPGTVALLGFGLAVMAARRRAIG